MLEIEATEKIRTSEALFEELKKMSEKELKENEEISISLSAINFVT